MKQIFQTKRRNLMTCIIGLTENGVTWLGADSCGSNGYDKTIRKDRKVFKLKDTPNAIAGYTSSFRMGQLLMYANNLIDKRDEPNINHEYLVKYFVPNIIKLFEDGGYSRNDNGEKSGGVFLLAYKDKLYKIESDYQVGESTKNYNACGCGEEFALGSLLTTEDMNLSPIERIHKALQSASTFSCGVAPPFIIINTENNDVIELKD
jgi:ATP-dependent protease HslVU (ClpYQ) peptidase subunit